MLRNVVTLFLCVLFIGCADDTKYQAELRGTWFLTSRKLARGDVLTPPQVSGLVEWFPADQNKAHVHLSVTDDHDSIRLRDSLYELSGNAFKYKTTLQIGDVAGDQAEMTYDTSLKQGSGQITSDDARVTLKHDNGMQFEFIGAQLTITYANGTVDTWQRNKDQKGVLAK